MSRHIDFLIKLHLFCIRAWTSVILFIFFHASLRTVLHLLTAAGKIKNAEMITAFASAFVVFGKNESLVLRFGLDNKITILPFENFCELSIKLVQSLPNTLNLVSCDTAWFKLLSDKFMKILRSKLLFWKPESCFPTFGYLFFQSYQVDQMLKSAELWQLQLFWDEFIGFITVKVNFFQNWKGWHYILVCSKVNRHSFFLTDENSVSLVKAWFVGEGFEKIVNVFVNQFEISFFCQSSLELIVFIDVVVHGSGREACSFCWKAELSPFLDEFGWDDEVYFVFGACEKVLHLLWGFFILLGFFVQFAGHNLSDFELLSVLEIVRIGMHLVEF